MRPRFVLGTLALGLLAILTWAVLALPGAPAGLTGPSLARLPQSGVANPVTAVLLNYRGYDTLLEVSVLLLTLVGVWSLRRGEWPASDLRDRPLLRSLLRLLLPVLALAAGHLLWIGAFAPGGAFQGGALLGGALVLVMLGGLGRGVLNGGGLLRAGLAAGVLVFVTVCAVTMLLTGELLEYPAGSAGAWIMVIEVAAVVSIGLTLGLLYLGGRPSGAEVQGPKSEVRPTSQ
jgi:multisubunit Na+/H+ antiporter MnhB subunit